MNPQILALIEEELNHQNTKWGEHRILPQDIWITILTEEMGEVARARLEHDVEGYISELVDVAASAISAIQGVYDIRQENVASTPADGDGGEGGGE